MIVYKKIVYKINGSSYVASNSVSIVKDEWRAG